MNEVKENQIQIPYKAETVRSEMLQEAAELSKLLVNRGNVEKIGIAGSLIKGKENPSDIDLVIFIDDKNAIDCQKEKINLLRQNSNKKVKLDKYLTLNDTDWNIFSGYYQSVTHPIDIIIISNEPSENYIKMMANDNLDPNFLENIVNTTYLYNPQTNTFEKKEVFNKKQEEMMRQASFERLKQVLSGPNHPLYKSIEKSHSRKKRMKSIGLKEFEDIKGGNSKIEVLDKKRKVYEDLIKSFDDNPYSLELWNKVVKLAESEITQKSDDYSTYSVENLTGYNYYDHIPLNELIKVGERLRSTENTEERYKILLEKNSLGKLWYDVVLGYVNDKMFQPIVEILDFITSYGTEYKKALDVGCGSGNSLKEIAPFCSVCVGLDNLEMSLKAARDNNLPENVTLVNGEATDLPFNKNEFDLVVSDGLTHYLTTEEVKKYVNEVNKVLKPGGNYFGTITNTIEGRVLPRFEEEYLYSAKAVLVCLLDRMCSNDKNINKTENTIMTLLNEFKKLGYYIELPDFNKNDTSYLRFVKNH